MHPVSSGDESWFPVFDWRDKPTFHKHLKRRFPSGICMCQGPSVFCFKWNGQGDALTRKKDEYLCWGLNAGSSFISQDERMSEAPVKTLQKALVLHLMWTRGLTSLWHLERLSNSSAWKVDNAWQFLNIVSNPNITVPTIMWPSVPHLTSISVCIVLATLV